MNLSRQLARAPSRVSARAGLELPQVVTWHFNLLCQTRNRSEATNKIGATPQVHRISAHARNSDLSGVTPSSTHYFPNLCITQRSKKPQFGSHARCNLCSTNELCNQISGCQLAADCRRLWDFCHEGEPQ